MRFKDDTKKYKGVGQYPTYHTGYETFYLMDEIIDPGFKIHRTCAQVNFRITFCLLKMWFLVGICKYKPCYKSHDL